MGNISSINFKNANLDNQLLHNTIDRPKYTIGGEVKYNKEPLEAYNLCKKMIEKAKINYANNCKARDKRFKAKSYLKSVVLNIKDEKELPMDDAMAKMEEVAKHLHDKYGFQCYQISIHRDEGHIDDVGNKHINHHAHMEICTLDDKTGFNRFKEIGPKQLSDIQTEIANLLEMKRGEYVRDSKRKRIEPRKWAILKEQEKANTRELKADLEQVKAENKALKQELASQKAVNTAFEEIRQLMIADGISTADGYKELAKYKRQALQQAKNKDLTQEQLNIQIAQIQQSYDKKLKEAKEQALEQLKTEMDERAENQLENDLDIYLNQAETPKDKELIKRILILDNLYVSNARIDINKLKNENDSLKKLADNKPNSENNSDDIKEQIKTLEKENKDLKAENKRLKDFLNIHNLLDKFNDYVASLLSNPFVEKLKNMVSNHQEPNHAEPSQEPKESKFANYQYRYPQKSNQNKGRGGR